MTKFAKMSLVAAVAVAGFTTTSSAKALEEAIKNVDVSGTVAYRYNDAETGTPSNNYKIAVNVSSKVNDDITANTRFTMGRDTGSDTNAASLPTATSGDANVNVQLQEVNFTYTGVQGLSVTFGKQGIATPWTVARDAMGDEQTGTGVVAAYTAGPATLVGAYFNQTNFDDSDAAVTLDGSADIYVLGAMATFAGVTIDGFYADLEDQFDAYTIGLSASYDVGAVKLSPFARYSQLDPEAVLGTTEDQKLWQLGLTADMGIFSAFLAYGESDKDGGAVYIDSGAATNMDYHWTVTADGSADTEYLYAHVTAQVTEKINVGLFYSEADYNPDYSTEDDYSEIYGQVSYQMSKNFATYVRFGSQDIDDTEDGTMGRLHVQYSF